ncbi:DUF485 domain-containing protein [Desulfobacter latus]|uniref:DUF485 domain-containing protein n=1 Tax=Desulfobacter latus TaxID=2292 RepID=A0A850T5H2_9BACT|nr:DUF485 domain-containing protein [Desulfobacter latus]NWH04155.1 DUF485 domain-containing protein [Desulfobacter latus]
MGHGPSTDWGEDKAIAYKTTLGLWLFLIYVLVYVGFIWINVASPKTMATIVFAGQNLAVVYGFGLIVLAFVMGIIYDIFCTNKEDELNKEDSDK